MGVDRYRVAWVRSTGWPVAASSQPYPRSAEYASPVSTSQPGVVGASAGAKATCTVSTGCGSPPPTPSPSMVTQASLVL